MKKIPGKKSRAIVTITMRGVGEDGGRGDVERKKISLWLRKHAREIVRDGWNYAGRFTARYYE